MNAAYCVEVLKRLKRRINHIRPEYKEPGSWSSLDYNAPAHSSNIVKCYLAENQIAYIYHVPYSADLALADFFLFPKLKIVLKGQFFEDVPSIRAACTDNFRGVPGSLRITRGALK